MAYRNIIITGASGGIAQALIEKLLEDQACERIYALSRSALEPKDNRVQPLFFDAASDESMESAANQIIEEGAPVDLIVQCAALLHAEGREGAPNIRPEKRVESITRNALERSFMVNAFAPILFLKALMPLLTRDGAAPLIANFSARVGSVSDNRIGGWYSYRASKAAQNQLTKTFAIELKRRAPQAIVFSYHPGTVRTDLSAPFSAHTPKEKLFSPQQAVDYFLRVAASLEVDQSGAFLDWDNKTIEY